MYISAALRRKEKLKDLYGACTYAKLHEYIYIYIYTYRNRNTFLYISIYISAALRRKEKLKDLYGAIYIYTKLQEYMYRYRYR